MGCQNNLFFDVLDIFSKSVPASVRTLILYFIDVPKIWKASCLFLTHLALYSYITVLKVTMIIILIF